MSVAAVLEELAQAGVRIWAEGDQLALDPREKLTPHLMALVRAHKTALLEGLTPELPDAPAHTERSHAAELPRAPARKAARAPRLSAWPIHSERYCYACAAELQPRQPYLLREGEVSDIARRAALLDRGKELLGQFDEFGLVAVVTFLQSQLYSTGVKLP